MRDPFLQQCCIYASIYLRHLCIDTPECLITCFLQVVYNVVGWGRTPNSFTFNLLTSYFSVEIDSPRRVAAPIAPPMGAKLV